MTNNYKEMYERLLQAQKDAIEILNSVHDEMENTPFTLNDDKTSDSLSCNSETDEFVYSVGPANPKIVRY